MLFYWGVKPAPHPDMEYVQLASGQRMPAVGLGTWQARAEEIERAVLDALDAGYRHFDTAFNYGNEQDIGRALRSWLDDGRGRREDLFIVTKLPMFANKAELVETYLRKSLERLQLQYLDLYLIHGPFGMQADSTGEVLGLSEDGCPTLDLTTDHVGIWKEMERMVDLGLVRSLGVSNFNLQQVRRLVKAARVPVSVNQVELHASLQQRDLVDSCRELGVAVTAYSPLGSPGAQSHFISKYNYRQAAGRGPPVHRAGVIVVCKRRGGADNFPDLLGHPLVRELSLRYQKTPGQVLLRFLLQLKVAAIPKSANPTRIRENINIFDFELKAEEVESMRALDRGEKGRIFNFFFWKGINKHPEYPFPLPEESALIN
ncbi:1,5-anhydro-D-fructose reductase [Frankliniella fusca]|uniref:1,5-anhydro-D-fructose reductase n=1 Tax=Frankliniella fusca TaxID=407009 RepID=A0AAE1I3M4_9NEOP|nr:1,5-anhydro-D-fructose reductase [Frankliniella fusca]